MVEGLSQSHPSALDGEEPGHAVADGAGRKKAGAEALARQGSGTDGGGNYIPVVSTLRSAACSFESGYNGAAQLIDRVTGLKVLPQMEIVQAEAAAKPYSCQWLEQQIGGGLGMMPWFLAASRLTRGGASSICGTAGTVDSLATDRADSWCGRKSFWTQCGRWVYRQLSIHTKCSGWRQLEFCGGSRQAWLGGSVHVRRVGGIKPHAARRGWSSRKRSRTYYRKHCRKRYWSAAGGLCERRIARAIV